MGMSVDIHLYSVSKLKDVLDTEIKVEEGLMKPSEFIEKTLETAGAYSKEKDVIAVQTCDYWNEYSPLYSWQRAIETYYHIEDCYDLFKEAELDWSYEGADEEEFYGAAGVDSSTLKPHPYDDEEED